MESGGDISFGFQEKYKLKSTSPGRKQIRAVVRFYMASIT